MKPIEKNLRRLHGRGLDAPRVDDLDALLAVAHLLSAKPGAVERVRDAVEQAIDAEGQPRSDLLRVWFGLPAIDPSAPDTHAMTSTERHHAAWKYAGKHGAESSFRTHQANAYYEALTKWLLASSSDPQLRSTSRTDTPAPAGEIIPAASSDGTGSRLFDRVRNRQLFVWLGGMCVVIALAVAIAVSTEATGKRHAGIHKSTTSIPSIVDATSGQLLVGTAAIPHPDRIGNVQHLVASGATACIEHYDHPDTGCKYQSATRHVCSNITDSHSNTCQEVLVPRIFQTGFGDVVHFRIPLSDATLIPLPFIELYLQSVRYDRPTNEMLVQITARWPGSTYGYAEPHLVKPPDPLCPPRGGVCAQNPHSSSEVEGEESLAQITLEFAPGEEGRLSYRPGSAALLDGKGHVLARPSGDMLDTWGITLANLEPKSTRVLAFEAQIDSP